MICWLQYMWRWNAFVNVDQELSHLGSNSWSMKKLLIVELLMDVNLFCIKTRKQTFLFQVASYYMQLQDVTLEYNMTDKIIIYINWHIKNQYFMLFDTFAPFRCCKATMFCFTKAALSSCIAVNTTFIIRII